MESLYNLDLLSVGIAIAAIGILGFLVFFSDQKSTTNRTFFLFAIVSVLWNIFNYLVFKFTNPELIIWVLRVHVFFAVWYAFCLFHLFYVFPKEKVSFGRKYKILIFFICLVAILNLSPLTFVRVTEFTSEGYVKNVMNGPGIFVFGPTVVGLILSGFFVLLRKIKKSVSVERKQLQFILAGFLMSFFLHITFNFIFPAILNNSTYAPFGALFTFPLIGFTAYSIFKHKLLSIKIIATEILAFVISAVTLFQVILADNLTATIFHTGVFLLILSFSILLIKSVRREVEQREKLEVLTKELEKANEKLKELDRLKSEFLSFASHQVKAPMAVVKGFAALIYDGTYGAVPDKVKESAKKIIDSADRMVALVNNLLDLRKIEEGKMAFKFEKVGIQKLVSDIVEEFKLLADNKKLKLTFESAIEEQMVSLDTEKFRQVIQNLIDNSIKYTDEGWVKVSMSQDGKSFILVTISDSGRGIPKDLLPKLFEQFKRDPSMPKQIAGTGLGLYIARQIVLAHKGEVWAESDGEGKGSRFIVKIPS